MDDAQSDIALLRAVLLGNCGSDAAAASYVADARALGVDPLDYCAHRLGLGASLVWERAAHWAGLPFSEQIPCGAGGLRAHVRLDRMAGTRSLRVPVGPREIVFLVPDFRQMVAHGEAHRRGEKRFHDLCATPRSVLEGTLARLSQEALLDHARQRMTQVWPYATASQDRTRGVSALFVAAFAALTVLAAVGAYLKPWLVPLMAVLLMLPGLARFAAAFGRAPARGRQPPPLTDAQLPLYTVLVPLRDEANMVRQLGRALSLIDYPPEKLDIRFVVEETSTTTVAAVRELLGDPRFQLVLVPDGKPRTKPKALDYALPQARGELIVVYDAEDIPEPDQLRIAASHFAADRRLACLQAELVPENADESALAALFAGEYAGLFGRLLPALARWRMPLPLGGTSNHFRTATLRRLGGWDAFNVTEDADLGVRLARRRVKTATFASRTSEEAPLTLKAWMAQRTRWMKGWMQTFIVHNRRPDQLLADLGWRGFLAFQVLVASMILSSMLHTAFVVAVIIKGVVFGLASLLPTDLWDWVSLAILLSGYGGAFAVVFSGLAHLKRRRLVLWQLLLPLYWVLHSIAAVRAAVQLLSADPSYWAKTAHGLTRRARHGGEGRLAQRRPAPAE